MMRRAHLKADRQPGFSLIELVVVIAIVATLAAGLLNRVQLYQEQAEKVAMEQTVGAIQSALYLQGATLIAKGKVSEMPTLARQNPMAWLAQKPKNYLGEFFAPKPQDVESGYWYFDLQSGNLIYSVRNDAHFRTEKSQRNQILYHVQLITGAQDRDRASDNTIEGVTLDPVVPYKWF
ncbi:MAG TPA: type II secretion system protein [Burkholderiaceae bacterium]|nr:type II secretion system protein [Burkholderiaceae bacterium]